MPATADPAARFARADVEGRGTGPDSASRDRPRSAVGTRRASAHQPATDRLLLPSRRLVGRPATRRRAGTGVRRRRRPPDSRREARVHRCAVAPGRGALGGARRSRAWNRPQPAPVGSASQAHAAASLRPRAARRRPIPGDADLLRGLRGGAVHGGERAPAGRIRGHSADSGADILERCFPDGLRRGSGKRGPGGRRRGLHHRPRHDAAPARRGDPGGHQPGPVRTPRRARPADRDAHR